MTPYEALEKAISLVADEDGRCGVPNLAKAIGIGVTRLDNLRRRRMTDPSKSIPGEWCPAIERAVSGGVTCEQLCPDADWSYLRSRKARGR